MNNGFDLAVSFVQAAIFLAVGLRATLEWRATKAVPQGHLAIATSLWGANSLANALSRLINGVATCADPVPRFWTVAPTVLLLAGLYAYLTFLKDFLNYPTWAHVLAIVVSVGLAGLAVVTKAAYAIDTAESLKPMACPGFSSADRTLWQVYVVAILVWLFAVFAVLAVSFLRYSRRVHGLARFRMSAIATGFLLILVAIVVLSGGLTGAGGGAIIRVIQLLALGAAPALLFGFTPPAFIKARYPA